MESLVYDFQSLWWKWLWPILEIVIGFGLVVFIHELGHFTAAKAVGIKVEQFALGFGPRLFGFKTRETDYRINLLPMGGYVKMAGQEDFRPLEEQPEIDPRAFSSKPVSARLGVISAGVVMNVILACQERASGHRRSGAETTGGRCHQGLACGYGRAETRRYH